MPTTRIDWKEGEGQILASYGGAGEGSLRFSSTMANKGLDRSQKVQVASRESPLEVEVTVTQTGLREEMCMAQAGNPELMTADGQVFAVLKV
mgnify:CR=1 FL=1